MELTNFAIFKNKYKEKDIHPDYKIRARDVEGKYIDVGAGWIKSMNNGEKYISCKISSPQSPTNEVKDDVDF